jgi:uncharacterized surface protein with fasciclin (FAS1) repeats
MIKPITFATAIWGEWYADIFSTLLARSLMAPNNFPKVRDRGHATYLIYTDAATAERLRAASVWPRLADAIQLGIREVEIDYDWPIAAHHRIWTRARIEATKNGSAIVFIAPDTMWADGSIGRIADLFDDGYGGIFIPGFRTAFDTFQPAMLASFGASNNEPIALSSIDLMSHAMEHMHPLNTVFLRNSTTFPDFSENILWPVDADGFVLREPIAHSLIAIDPNVIEVDEHTLPVRPEQLDRIYWINGSEDILFVSLGPLARDLHWFDAADSVDANRVGLRSIVNDGVIVDALMRRKFRFHRELTDERRWKAVERASDLFMHRVAVARNAIKIFHQIDIEGCTRAGALLAAALFSRDLAHAVLYRDQVTIFCPVNSGLPDTNDNKAWSQFMDESKAHDFRRFLLLHVVDGYFPLATLAQMGNGNSLPGGKLTIHHGPDGTTINRVPIVRPDIVCGKHIIHIVEAPLAKLP